MTRPAIAIVTGFTKNATLFERSFAPLRALRRAGVLTHVLYLTWDKSEIDEYVEPARAMPEVEHVRVPEPQVFGPSTCRGVGYQIANLEAALARVPDDDALIVKLRPDFIADENFLAAKIGGFDTLCAPSRLQETFGVESPPSPFAAKIWIPWADANLPLHYEDAAFMGLKRDVAQFANRTALKPLASPLLSHICYAWFAHVMRYAMIFLPGYPIFANYVGNFRCFVNDLGYRTRVMPAAVQEPFFWQLIAANAWILANHFHVDCGTAGQLIFYTNSNNPGADWSSLRKLKIHPPYHAVDEWRRVQRPGGLLPCAGRTHARLVDDSWQHALFTRPDLTDVTRAQLRDLVIQALQYDPEIDNPLEEHFYLTLESQYRAWIAEPANGYAKGAA